MIKGLESNKHSMILLSDKLSWIKVNGKAKTPIANVNEKFKTNNEDNTVL